MTDVTMAWAIMEPDARSAEGQERSEREGLASTHGDFHSEVPHSLWGKAGPLFVLAFPLFVLDPEGRVLRGRLLGVVVVGGLTNGWEAVSNDRRVV